MLVELTIQCEVSYSGGGTLLHELTKNSKIRSGLVGHSSKNTPVLTARPRLHLIRLHAHPARDGMATEEISSLAS